MGDPHRDLEHLRKLAQMNPTMRFNKLYKIIKQEPFLQMVWQKVQTNSGSRTPGIDGRTKDDIDVSVIHTLAQQIATRQYRPQPVRRTYIPKRGKPDQLRGLGIPTLRDRIVQAAIARVLEALYEPLFRSCSYGFRPGRNTIQALRHVAQAYRSGVTWIVEGDLENCFGSLPHAVILTCLRKRIKDERFIDLIRQLLQAGGHGRRTLWPNVLGGTARRPMLPHLDEHRDARVRCLDGGTLASQCAGPHTRPTGVWPSQSTAISPAQAAPRTRPNGPPDDRRPPEQDRPS